MIVVRLSSGFGNQLFQYAFALYLQERYLDTVYLDMSWYKYRSTYRKSAIDIISNLPVISDKKIYYNYKSVRYQIKKILFALNPSVRRINEANLSFPPNDKFLYFDGYWQTDKYVKQMMDPAAYFEPREPMPDFIRNYCDDFQKTYAISLHVRRGDFFSTDFINRFGICTPDYYERAVCRLTKDLDTFTLYVFSDDPEWVKAHIKLPSNSIFIRNEDINPYWYVSLMSKCRDNIISNSSFSWWGAYLNNNPKKKVVAPDKWLLGEKNTIALENWIKIQV
ncbi:MAG: alpha-1,2-fucosyltransferase [Bacteroidales bacterium]|nr:alpha-1,2-fucosyltransferase [Bacteroidales bacterium]